MNIIFFQIIIKLNTSNLANPEIYQQYDYLRYHFSSMMNSPNITDQEKKSFGLTLGQFVISCHFNMIPCNMSLFEWYFDNYYGEFKLKVIYI